MSLVALLCIFSSISMSFLRYGLHACIQYSKWGLTIALYRGTIKLLSLYVIFLRIIPRTWLALDAAILELYIHIIIGLYRDVWIAVITCGGNTRVIFSTWQQFRKTWHCCIPRRLQWMQYECRWFENIQYNTDMLSSPDMYDTLRLAGNK